MTDLNKIRDELSERYASLSEPELTRIHMKNDYKNGFDAAIEVLAKQSVEFDAVKAIVKMEASEGPADFERELSLLNLLKWQHQQTAAIFEAKLAVAREALENECWCGDNEGEFVKCVPCEALEKLGGG